MKSKSNQKGFAPIILLVIVVLAVGGFFAYQKIGKTQNGKSVSLFNLFENKPSPQPKVMILGATTTKSIDPETGKGGPEVATFSTKDPVIYAVLQVNKSIKGTKFEYVRYYKGKYVDHKSLETTKDGVDYVSFSWKLKTAKSRHLPGDYKIKLYTNGNFEKELSFIVR